MIIGGIAVIARGVRRMTTDIDAVVRGDLTSTAALLRAFASERIVPRITNAEAFARESLVLLLRHAPTEVELDVSLGWTAFEHAAIDARSDAKYGSVVAPMARAEDLVVFKTLAARPKDIEDAAALLLMHEDIDLEQVRRRLAELAELADEPALIRGLEAVTARALAARKRQGVATAQRSAQIPRPTKPTPKRPRKTATTRKPKPRLASTTRKRSKRR